MAFKSLDDLEFVEPEGQVLGEGGFSQVKLVRLKTNKKLYALKCVRSFSIDQSEADQSSSFRQSEEGDQNTPDLMAPPYYSIRRRHSGRTYGLHSPRICG